MSLTSYQAAPPRDLDRQTLHQRAALRNNFLRFSLLRVGDRS